VAASVLVERETAWSFTGLLVSVQAGSARRATPMLCCAHAPRQAELNLDYVPAAARGCALVSSPQKISITRL
jgi:hypothetical protein